MKKFCKRLLGIFVVLVLGYQQFCFADVIVMPTTTRWLLSIFGILGEIGIIVLFISAISYFSIKKTVYNIEPNNEKYTLDTKEIEERKNKIKDRFYIWGTIIFIVIMLTITRVLPQTTINEIFSIIILIPIILFISSIIVRLNKNRKLANKITRITIYIFGIIILLDIVLSENISKYNEQFLKYTESEGVGMISPKYVSNVEGLIDETIENNKKGRKTIIIYEDINYKSSEELNNLLKIIDTNKEYSFNEYYNDGWIEEIRLDLCINDDLDELEKDEEDRISNEIEENILFKELRNYRGEKITEEIIRELFDKIKLNLEYNENININIIFILGENEEETQILKLNSDNFESIENLKNDITSKNLYNVEVESESENTCNIIIRNIYSKEEYEKNNNMFDSNSNNDDSTITNYQ